MMTTRAILATLIQSVCYASMVSHCFRLLFRATLLFAVIESHADRMTDYTYRGIVTNFKMTTDKLQTTIGGDVEACASGRL